MRRQRCVRQPGQKCRLAARPRVPPPGWAPPHGRPPEAHETPSVVRPHAAPKVFTPLLSKTSAPRRCASMGCSTGSRRTFRCFYPPRPPSIRCSASAPLRASLLACFCPLRRRCRPSQCFTPLRCDGWSSLPLPLTLPSPTPLSALCPLLQIRGAFTSLYQNLTPATWAGMFRHGGGKDMLVNDMLRATHAATRRSGRLGGGTAGAFNAVCASEGSRPHYSLRSRRPAPRTTAGSDGPFDHTAAAVAIFLLAPLDHFRAGTPTTARPRSCAAGSGCRGPRARAAPSSTAGACTPRYTHEHARNAAPFHAYSCRTCCAPRPSVRRSFVGCSFGCAPFRMRPMPACHADAATLATAIARVREGGGGGASGGGGGDGEGDGGRRRGRRRRRRESGDAPVDAAGSAVGGGDGDGGGASFDPALWWAAESAEAEVGPLKNHQRQFWPNGVMRCEFCGGWFNGWRGY